MSCHVLGNVSLDHRDIPGFLICTSLLYHTSRGHNHSVWGKREAHISWSMVILEKAAPVTGTTLRTTDPVLADSR